MNTSSRTTRPEAASEWRSALTITATGLLFFLTLSGVLVTLLPFGTVPQTSLLIHSLLGLVALPIVVAYLIRHWRHRHGGNLSHYQLLGYSAAVLVLLCLLTGLIVTWQALFSDRLQPTFDLLHLLSGLAVPFLLGVHLATVVLRPGGGRSDRLALLTNARRRFWIRTSAITTLGLLLVIGGAQLHPDWHASRAFPDRYDWRFGADRPFAPSLAKIAHAQGQTPLATRIGAVLDPALRAAYERELGGVLEQATRNQHYAGDDSGPFAQHHQALQLAGADTAAIERADAVLAAEAEHIRSSGALDENALSGSERCGSCHRQIYEEWLPSAHRYAAMDLLFSRVEQIMAEETSPEHTRYCAGCHDPISLFSGTKNQGNATLSAAGFTEGISCVSCHAIIRADVQGNADYTLALSSPYLFERDSNRAARWISDFMIRAYPQQHVSSYSRPLYKTSEFCAACHKQYMDIDLNTDIGRVQGQNQYDSWARSRWHDETQPERTLHCRECHMPLVDSLDPAAGDSHDRNRSAHDRKHRSHRYLGGNQYLPLVHRLEGAEEQVQLTEQWLRGEIEIPEIASRWTDGPVIRMTIDAPAELALGGRARFQVILTNNKTGHEFPTGPLDMIESWLEIRVHDDRGRELYRSGQLDDSGVVQDPVVWLKADAFDREGAPIDRHNLWDLVGKSYSRTLYPGMTDRVELPLECPSITLRRLAEQQLMDIDATTDPSAVQIDRDGQRRIETVAFDLPQSSPGTLEIEAILWYRKVNPEFMDRVFGGMDQIDPAPRVTEINRARRQVRLIAGRDE